MRTTILVLANQTASSEELLSTLEARGSRDDVKLEFVVPPVGPDPESCREAERRLDEALQVAREAGFEATGSVGTCEIIVSTLPASISHWLGIDLPARVARATNALVSHVAVEQPRAQRRAASAAH